jgi:four helix bundle protein
MRIFELSKTWPVEERFSLTDQVRRSSRSVATHIAEAWRKRKYEAAFVSKLNDAEGEAAETQTHLELARRCRYLDDATSTRLDGLYDDILPFAAALANARKARACTCFATASSAS